VALAVFDRQRVQREAVLASNRRRRVRIEARAAHERMESGEQLGKIVLSIQ